MMRTHGKAWRPDLILEDERKKEIFYMVDVACPAEGNKSEKKIKRSKNINSYVSSCEKEDKDIKWK